MNQQMVAVPIKKVLNLLERLVYYWRYCKLLEERIKKTNKATVYLEGRTDEKYFNKGIQGLLDAVSYKIF